MAAKKIKKSKGDIIFDIINYTFFTLFMLLCVFPFYYVVINSISANNLVDTGHRDWSVFTLNGEALPSTKAFTHKYD